MVERRTELHSKETTNLNWDYKRKGGLCMLRGKTTYITYMAKRLQTT